MHIERPDRIDYQTAVCLTSAQRGLSVSGLTTNVSESGIFVTVPNPFEVGAEVICELPLPGEHLRLRGMVVWVEELNEPCDDVGMGIEFSGLSAADLVVLRHFIDLHQDEITRSVMVRFEGYSRPIRAKAAVTDKGLQLWTTLPFLRLSSPVDVAFEAEDYRKEGVLHQVALDIAGAVPRLQIDVEIPQKDEWQAGEVIYSAADASEASGIVSGTIETADNETMVDAVDGEASESDWSLGTPPEEPRYDRFWREAERRRHRMWLWIAAFLMAGIAVSSVIQTDLWRNIAKQFQPVKEEPALSVAVPTVEKASVPSVSGEKPAKATETKATIEKDKSPPTKPVSRAAQNDRQAKAGRKGPADWAQRGEMVGPAGRAAQNNRLLLTNEGDGVQLRIPIGGSIASARHYRLADPDGIAVNLPKAQPDLAPGHYVLNREGFRAVWIRQRQGGLQVRVFFSGDSPQHDVKLEAQSVIVKLDPQ